MWIIWLLLGAGIMYIALRVYEGAYFGEKSWDAGFSKWKLPVPDDGPLWQPTLDWSIKYWQPTPVGTGIFEVHEALMLDKPDIISALEAFKKLHSKENYFIFNVELQTVINPT